MRAVEVRSDNGRVLTMTDYDGYVTSYTYTSTGQVDTITAPGSKVWNFDYNLLGQRTQYTHPNGMKTIYTYDTMNRLTKIDHTNGSGTTLKGWEYVLSKGGNILSIENLLDAGGWDYGYDGRDRLVHAIERNSTAFPAARFGYAYDTGDEDADGVHVAARGHVRGQQLYGEPGSVIPAKGTFQESF